MSCLARREHGENFALDRGTLRAILRCALLKRWPKFQSVFVPLNKIAVIMMLQNYAAFYDHGVIELAGCRYSLKIALKEGLENSGIDSVLVTCNITIMKDGRKVLVWSAEVFKVGAGVLFNPSPLFRKWRIVLSGIGIGCGVNLI